MALRRPVGLVALAAMVGPLLALATPAAAQAPPGSTVFINEIHYDNTGTDAGEFVEIAGPAGTDLSGWSVVLYNGGSTTAAAAAAVTYDADVLAGPIPTSGAVAVQYGVNGIQNGAPDGVALVDAAGRVVQFLSYEGVLTASNGPAAGITSTDIGVDEAGTEPVGQSLQLTGTGSTYGAFTWAGPAAATPGTANGGQVFQGPDQAGSPVASCPAVLITPAGTATSAQVSAQNADSVVSSATITSAATAGIALEGFTASTSTTPASATLTVSGDVAAGDYPVEITFTADDARTGSCSVQLAVTAAVGEPDVTPISQVQGSGATSPLAGQQVTVEGVVVGDYQDAGQFRGFYVQDLAPDADPLTSEGIRVFTDATPVAVGDRVRVTGTVREFASASSLYSGSETQIDPVSSVTVLGTAPVPAPTAVTLPFAATDAGVDGQERFEGMLATLVNDDLVATDLYTLGRFGEVSLTTGEVLYIPTSAEQDAANNADRITLDDGLSGQNLSTLPYTVGGDGETLPRAGDAPVDPVTGVLTYSFGEWRIQPAVGTTIDFAVTNPRELAPSAVGGNVQIASFNVLNYFVAFGGANRGADNAAELQRQQDKLVAAITGLDADVVGLIEIANDDGAALTRLVDAVNAAQPDAADAYTAVVAPALNAPTSLGGTYGTDAIRQAIIYRAAVVSPVGTPPSDPAILNPSDPAFPDEPVFDRPPAVQTFTPVGGERDVTVVVNHFKSKGSANSQCGTPDPFGGNCDDLRERQSAALVDLVEDLGVQDVALLGDFNAYEAEAPIGVLETAGYVSSVADQPRADRSSYSFDGEFGSLDYIFLSPSLAPAKTGADIWQINSPEAVALDYNSYNQPQLYQPGPFGSSDHDPVLVGLGLLADPAGPLRLTLLHNNDGESALLPVAPRGGIARFGTLVKELRTEADAEGGSLLLSSGDNFLAGPQLQASLENYDGDTDYSNDGPFYDALAMDYLDYDASAVGNHEFDFGPNGLGYFISQFKESEIRFVSSNLDVTGEEALEQFVSPPPGEPGTLVEWTRTEVDGRSVAIVGATTPRLPSITSPGPDVEAREDVQQAVQAAIDAATADGTDVVVLIAHLQNITEDQALVAELTGIDAVIAGGGDELLANADDVLLPGAGTPFGAYPLLATSADATQVPIVTAQGSYGYLGRLILDIDEDGQVTAIDDRSGPVRNVFDATTPPADQKLPDEFLLANVEAPVATFTAGLRAQVVAQSDVVLDARTPINRSQETNLGSLFADALRVTAEQGAPEFGATNPTVALQNSGGIRSDSTYGPGPISRFDTFQIAPFSNFVGYTLDLSPEKLKELLERSVSANVTGDALQPEGRFGQLSGIELVYDPLQQGQVVVRNADGSVTVTTAGQRVRQLTLTNNTEDTADDIVVVRNGVVVEGAPSVDLAANSFTVGQNGDNYPFNLTEGQFINLPTTYQKSLEDHLRTLGTVTSANYPEGGLGRIAVGGDVVIVEPEPEPEPVCPAVRSGSHGKPDKNDDKAGPPCSHGKPDKDKDKDKDDKPRRPGSHGKPDKDNKPVGKPGRPYRLSGV